MQLYVETDEVSAVYHVTVMCHATIISLHQANVC